MPRALEDGRGAGDLEVVEKIHSQANREAEADVSEREQTPEERGERVYDLFQRGSALLESGDFHAAAIPLEQARSLEPDKSSIREALGPRLLPRRPLRPGAARSSRPWSSATR